MPQSNQTDAGRAERGASARDRGRRGPESEALSHRLKLAAKAVDGDISAIKEIFDRTGSRKSRGQRPDEPPGKVVFQWQICRSAGPGRLCPGRAVHPLPPRFACIVTHRRAGKTGGLHPWIPERGPAANELT